MLFSFLYFRLKKLDDRRNSMMSKESSNLSSSNFSKDMIY